MTIEKTSNAIRVAVWGCGSFALKAHFPALLKLEQENLVRFDAVCARSEASIARARALLGRPDLRGYNEPHELLADRDIDLVVIALPIPAAAAAIRAALASGKAVISEKPCAASVQEAISLLDFHATLTQQPFWSVNENYRCKPLVAKVSELLRDGVIGQIYDLNFDFTFSLGPEPEGWRQAASFSGGYAMDFGVHYIAAMRAWFGEVSEVCARSAAMRPFSPGGDTLAAIMTFERGMLGTFKIAFASHVADFSRPDLKISGSHGLLNVNFRLGMLELVTPQGKQNFDFSFDSWETGGVYETLKHSIGALRGEHALMCTPQEALMDMAVIDAMVRSAQSGVSARPADAMPRTVPAARQEVHTFERAVSFRPKQITWCATLAELQGAVAQAGRSQRAVRVMGAGRSWATPVVTDDLLINTERLAPHISIDMRSKRVKASAGVQIGDVNRALASHNLCLPSLTCSPQSTIGGVISTGSHGTSVCHGTLSDRVTELTLVLASGELLKLNESHHPELLRAARVSVGMLGVVAEVELQAVDIQHFEFFQSTLDAQAFLAVQDELWAAFEYVWCKWPIGSDSLHVVYGKRASAEGQGIPFIGRGMEQPYWYGFLPDPPAAPRVPLFERGAQVRSMSAQYAFAAAQLPEMLAQLPESPFFGENEGRILEFKYLRGEGKSMLGPNIDARNVAINLAWAEIEQSRRTTAFDSFEQFAQGFHGRPHWGKHHTIRDERYVAQVFPEWSRFSELRRELDPAGIFRIQGQWMD
jgi:predicted dehydrogenase